jgi:L-iditol 2-dehydrogenase
MGEAMKAAIWTGPGTVEFGEVPKPEIKPDQVLVRVALCGLCGSDTHIVEGRLPVGPPPQVIGHEVVGEVVEVGAAVKRLELGTRVGCDLYGYCGRCPECRTGHPNLCRRKFFAAKGLAEYAVYRPEQLYALPEEIDDRRGALLEPVATCLHAVEVGAIEPGEAVLVIGGGALGLLVAQLAKRSGAARVVVSEPLAAKRELAVTLGADEAVDPGAVDLAELAASAGARGGFDAVFDVAGVAAVLAQAPELVATCGRVVVVAVHDPSTRIEVSPFLFYEREVALLGTYAAARSFPRALELLGQLRLEEMITGVEPLARITEVYAAHRAGEHVKVLLAP